MKFKMSSINYKMNRVKKGTRTFFFPTINGKRFTKTNYARKYDAVNLVADSLKKYGEEKLQAFFA